MNASLKRMIKELVHFNDEKYGEKVCVVKNTILQKEEVKLVREMLASKLAACLAAGLVLPSGGVTLVGIAISTRRVHVADQKLKLIWAEADRRGLGKHKVTAKDFAAAALCGLGPGLLFLGLDGGFAQFLATDVINAVMPTTSMGSRQVIEQTINDILQAVKDAAAADPQAVKNIRHAGHVVADLVPSEKLLEKMPTSVVENKEKEQGKLPEKVLSAAAKEERKVLEPALELRVAKFEHMKDQSQFAKLDYLLTELCSPGGWKQLKITRASAFEARKRKERHMFKDKYPTLSGMYLQCQ